MNEPSGEPTSRGRLARYWWVAGVAIAAIVVIVLAPLASTDPDGLERVAEDKGFLETAGEALYSIIPDYTVPGIDGNSSTILAGLIGIVIVFLVMTAVGRVLAGRRNRT